MIIEVNATNAIYGQVTKRLWNSRNVKIVLDWCIFFKYNGWHAYNKHISDIRSKTQRCTNIERARNVRTGVYIHLILSGIGNKRNNLGKWSEQHTLIQHSFMQNNWESRISLQKFLNMNIKSVPTDPNITLPNW